MTEKSLSKALMVIYGVAGVGTGLIFGRAQYHKGKADAYEDAGNRIKKAVEETERMIKAKEEA